MISSLILLHCITAVQPIALKIAWHESRFVESATNATGDYGVFQLNLYWQKKRTPGVTELDLLDPEINVKFACNLLENLYNEYYETDDKWWTRYHSYRKSDRIKYARRVNRDAKRLPERARVHPQSDHIPKEKYEHVYHIERQTDRFCQSRYDLNMLYFTIRYYIRRDHWAVLYRCLR